MRRVVLIAALLIFALGLGAAYATIDRWYASWMPAPMGRLAFPLEHSEAVVAAAGRNDLDPALVAAVIFTESGFDEEVHSERGAVGLMQVMPATAAEIARRSGGVAFEIADLRTPRINILYGCFYLRHLLDRYGGSVVPALAAYNAGSANVDDWLAASDELAVSTIPFDETRRYVEQVLRLRGVYRNIYGEALRARG